MAMLDEYRQNAFDCVQLARKANDAQNKAILLIIAQAWIKLAEQISTIGGVPGQPGDAAIDGEQTLTH